MSTLQFSLFFAAILIGYLLLHTRLVRFEKHLQEMAGLKTLNERLKAVSDTMERVRLDRVEEQLAQLHDDLVGLLEQLGRIERSVRQELAQVIVPAPRQTPAHSDAAPGERIRAAVETRLLHLGYRDLRVVTDLAAARLEDRLEVRIEAVRDQMPVKGVVTVHNGSVVDVAVKSAAQSFP